MRTIGPRLLGLLCLAAPFALTGGTTDKPQSSWREETLDYAISWPSGLSLGESHLKTSRGTDGKWRVEMSFDASIPGFAVLDQYKSLTTSDFCTVESEKSFAHGRKKGSESTTFDQEARKATRKTKDGGKTEIALGPCAKDGLTFLQFLRRELRDGRIPPSQPILFGANYTIKLDYQGSPKIRLGDAMVETEKLQATITGPASKTVVEMYFDRTPLRTPVLFKVPFALGTFSMELAR